MGIVVGVAPIEAPGMRETPTFTGWSSIGVLRRVQFGAAATAVRTGRFDGIVNGVTATLGEPDQMTMERPEVREWFLGVVREAYTQGGRGGAYESGLYSQPWGFDLDRTAADTALWYGGADTWVPASAGRWLADRLPNSRYSVWPEHGHFSWATSERAAEIVAEVIAAPD